MPRYEPERPVLRVTFSWLLPCFFRCGFSFLPFTVSYLYAAVAGGFFFRKKRFFHPCYPSTGALQPKRPARKPDSSLVGHPVSPWRDICPTALDNLSSSPPLPPFTRQTPYNGRYRRDYRRAVSSRRSCGTYRLNPVLSCSRTGVNRSLENEDGGCPTRRNGTKRRAYVIMRAHPLAH